MDNRKTIPWMEDDFDLYDGGSQDPFAGQSQFLADIAPENEKKGDWERESEQSASVFQF